MDAFISGGTEVEDIFVAMVMDVVAKEEVGGGSMVITHINLPPGTEHLWQRPVYTLQTNGAFSPCNKRIIFEK